MWLAGIGLVAAVPSLVWSVGGATFMHDDWWLADAYGSGAGHLWGAFWDGAVSTPARPGASLYYTISYGLFGTHPVLHVLLLAMVNGALGIFVYVVAERLWRTEIAVWVALVYAALPNRGSTRLWAAVAPNALAVVLVLGAVLLLLRGHHLWAGIVLGAAVLTYEGVLFLAALAVAHWVVQERKERLLKGAIACAPIALAAAFIFLRSPKRSTTPSNVDIVDRIVSTQFGSAIFEWSTLSAVGFAAIVFGLLVLVVLPTSRRPRYLSVVLAGVAIMLAAVAPYALVHWPLASAGFFDRANGVIGLGTAVLLGTLTAWIVDVVPARLGLVPAGAIVLVFFGLNVVDIHDYRAAADEGRTLLAQVAVDVQPTARAVRIVPPTEPIGGVAQFPAGSNLSIALELQRGDDVRFYNIRNVDEQEPPADAICYDRVQRVVGPCPVP
jgi:hypothetical protein